MKRLLSILLIIAALTAFSGGCLLQHKKNDLPKEAVVAVKTLEKLQAATEVGVSFSNYQALLIEAKAAVNAASRMLPPARPAGDDYSTDALKASLSDNLNKAIDSYADAQTAWDEKLHGRSLSPDKEPGKSLIPKYKLKTSDPEEAMQLFWYMAKLYTLSATGGVNTLKGE